MNVVSTVESGNALARFLQSLGVSDGRKPRTTDESEGDANVQTKRVDVRKLDELINLVGEPSCHRVNAHAP